jgi:hypothetical protein
VLSALVSIVQVFFPQWADGTIIAVSGLPGAPWATCASRTILASLLIWAAIALVRSPNGGACRAGPRAPSARCWCSACS